MGIANWVRAVLGRRGYVLWKREFIRYGVDPLLDVQRLARRWNRPARVAFDVGANVGQTSAELLAAFPDAEIHAFEPHPTTFAELDRMTHPRLRKHNLALGDTVGEVTLYEYGESGQAALRNSLTAHAPSAVQFGYGGRERTVASTTLDAFCREHGVGAVNLLKLDVEGFEAAVLRGGAESLSKVDFVYLEFNDLLPAPGASGGALLPLAEQLAPHGFRFVATYTDFVEQEGQFFVVANALFARL